MSDFTWKQKWLAITPKPFAFLSMIGSIYIIRSIFVKRRKLEVFHRMLLGLSVWDLMTSCAVFAGTWPIPKGTPGVFMASGNVGTCSAQGFFIQLGVGTPIYNASLATFYFFVICMGWKEHQLKRVEPLLHIVPVGFSLSTAIAAAATNSYANSNVWCWITPSNVGFRMGFFYGPVWASMLVATLSMMAICGHVIVQERRARRYRRPERSLAATAVSAAGANDRKDRSAANNRGLSSSSRRVATQAVFYVLSFYLTFVFPSWTRVSQMVTGSAPFAIIALFSIFFPCQGLFNCMVYLRPRLIKYRKKHPELNIFQIVHRTVMKNVDRRSNSTTASSNVDVETAVVGRTNRMYGQQSSHITNDSAT